MPTRNGRRDYFEQRVQFGIALIILKSCHRRNGAEQLYFSRGAQRNRRFAQERLRSVNLMRNVCGRCIRLAGIEVVVSAVNWAAGHLGLSGRAPRRVVPSKGRGCLILRGEFESGPQTANCFT